MSMKFIGMSLGALMLTAALSTALSASEWDHKTIVTISGPVEIPGRVLPAGTYVFKRADNEPNVVQILNQKQTHVIATLFTIPEEAVKTPTTTVFTLSERTKSAPEEIRSWFYPGDSTGMEFTYPQQGGGHHRLFAKVEQAGHPSL